MFEFDVSVVAVQARDIFPSIKMTRLGFHPPDGFLSLNPSIVATKEGLRCILRTVRYRPAPVTTRNFWLTLDDNLAVVNAREIVPTPAYPARVRDDCIGLEDMRPFILNDQIWVVASSRELNPRGWWSETGISQLDLSGSDKVYISDFTIIVIEGNPGLQEKNWMPFVIKDEFYFVYSVSPFTILDSSGNLFFKRAMPIRINMLRGGTQLLPFRDGWLFFIHEVFHFDGNRYYGHRGVYASHEFNEFKFTRRFFFGKPEVEFAAGIARQSATQDILISLGIADREGWIACINENEIYESLLDMDDAFATSDAPSISPVLGGAFWLANPEASMLAEKGICKALTDLADVEQAARLIGNEGLKNPSDRPTAYNEFIVLYTMTKHCPLNGSILEIPSDRQASFIRSVSELGYRSVFGIDKNLVRNERRHGIRWFRAFDDLISNNIEIDFIYCNNFISKVSDFSNFLDIVLKVLRRGGLLFLSFDFYSGEGSDNPEMTDQQLASILTAVRLQEFLKVAEIVNLLPLRAVDMTTSGVGIPGRPSACTLANVALKRDVA